MVENEITPLQSPVDLLIQQILNEQLRPFTEYIQWAQNNLATAQESFAGESESLREQRDTLNAEAQQASLDGNEELAGQKKAALTDKDQEIAAMSQRIVEPAQQELAQATQEYNQEIERIQERVNVDDKIAFKEYLESRIDQLPEEKQEAARQELANLMVKTKSFEEMKGMVSQEGSALNSFAAHEVEGGTSTSIMRIHVSQEGNGMIATITRADGKQKIQLEDGGALDLSNLDGRAVQITADKGVDGKVNLVGTEDVDIRFRGAGGLGSYSEIGKDGQAVTTKYISSSGDRYANPVEVFHVSQSDKRNFADFKIRSEMAKEREEVLFGRKLEHSLDALAMNKKDLNKANDKIAQSAASLKDTNPALAAAVAQALGEGNSGTRYAMADVPDIKLASEVGGPGSAIRDLERSSPSQAV